MILQSLFNKKLYTGTGVDVKCGKEIASLMLGALEAVLLKLED